MRVLNIQAENYKRLKVVDISPDGNVVEVTGKNKQGKSSLLDAIGAAMQGSAAIQEVPIRAGEKQSRIRVVLGDKEAELVVTRKFIQKDKMDFTTSLTVENAQGAKFPSPQAVLDALYSAIAFDPLAFVRSSKGAQLETMKRLVPGVDFNAIERQNKADFDKRTELNRDAKNIRAQVAGLPVDISKPRPVKQDVGDLQKEIAAAEKHNEDVTTRKANREAAPGEIKAWREQAAAKKTEAEALLKAAKALEVEADDYERRLKAAAALPALIEAKSITDKMEAINANNNLVLAWENMDQLVKQAEALEKQAQELSDNILVRNGQKERAISEAKLPVEGLSLTDQGVTLNGLPFDQVSSSEQIRTSVGVAMALNPKLRVIRVKDGSLLDEESMAILAEMAKEKDYQVWVERVATGEDVGIVMEEGEVKGAILAAASVSAPAPVEPAVSTAPPEEVPIKPIPTNRKPSKEL